MREVVGFEGRYSVTEDGQVFSHLRNHFLSQQLNFGGYARVGLLRGDGKFCFPLVHRLVATAYLPKPESLEVLEINHKDGVKTNNHVSNLEWVSRQRNVDHVYETGLRARAIKKERTCFVDPTKPQAFKPKMSLEEMSDICRLYDEMKSLRKVAKEVGVSSETVRQIIIAVHSRKEYLCEQE